MYIYNTIKSTQARITMSESAEIDNIDHTAAAKFAEVDDDAIKEMEERFAAAAALSSEIEKKISIESPEILQVEMPQFEPPKVKTNKTTKADLIKKIMELQEKLKVPNPRPESHFKKTNLAELEEHLAFLTNKAVNTIQGTNDPMKKQSAATAEAAAAPMPKSGKFSKDWGAKGLFQFNLILCKVGELASANFKEKLGTDLVGLCDDVVASKDELIDILAEIYEEHGEAIGEYLSPLNRYFLLMTTLGANRAMINKKRVEAELEKN